jgi:retinol dehydrogenase 12
MPPAKSSSNTLHPGFVATGFAKNNGRVIAALVSIFAPLVARSPAKGAQTSIFLASSPSVEGMTGKYFYDSQVIAVAPQSTDMVVARKLWDASNEIVHRANSVLAKTERCRAVTVPAGVN